MALLWPEVGRNLGCLRRFWDIERQPDQDNAAEPRPRQFAAAALFQKDRPSLASAGMVGYYFAQFRHLTGNVGWNESRGRHGEGTADRVLKNRNQGRQSDNVVHEAHHG